MKVFYLHGLGSTASSKAERLRQAGHVVLAPTLDHPQPSAVRATILATLTAHPDLDLVVGSSLGGFWGFYAAQCLNAPRTALLNPCLDPDRALASHEAPTDAVAAYADLRREAEAVPLDPARYRVYVALDDDVVNPQSAMRRFPSSALRVSSTGGHRLDHFAQLIPELAAFADEK